MNFSQSNSFTFQCLLLLFSLIGSQAVKDREAALQGGGGHVEGAAASQHRPFLRLVGRSLQRQEVHCAGHRADDVWHSENVSVEQKMPAFVYVDKWLCLCA